MMTRTNGTVTVLERRLAQLVGDHLERPLVVPPPGRGVLGGAE